MDNGVKTRFTFPKNGRFVETQKRYLNYFGKNRLINGTEKLKNIKGYEAYFLDAVGSGSTLNQIAKKMKDKKIAEQITGLAIVGSFKGFDVITDV